LIGHKTHFASEKDTGIYALGKAMAGYNAGTGYPTSHYFGERMLLSSRSTSGDGSYVKTKFGYWMAIKKHTQTDNRPGYIPYMTFIWPSGQTGLDLNGDGIITYDDPSTPDVVEGMVDGKQESTEPWCYAYGEKEWMSPFKVVEEGNRDAKRSDYLRLATIIIDRRVSCDY